MRSHEACRHSDPRTCSNCRDDSLARIDDDPGGRHDLNLPAGEPERPAKKLARALIAQIDRVVFRKLIRMLRRALCGEVVRRRVTAQTMRKEPPRQKARIREVADPDSEIYSSLDQVYDLVAQPKVNRHFRVERPELRKRRRYHMQADWQ